MRKEELNIRSSQKTITLAGWEQQVLVRWYWDCLRNMVVITEVLNGKEPVLHQCSAPVRADLRRQIRREHLEGCYRRVAELAGNQTLMPGGLR